MSTLPTNGQQETIRQRFLNALKARQGKKERFTYKVKDADIGITLETLPARTDGNTIKETARRIGCKASIKDEDGLLIGQGQKTFNVGEDAAGIVSDMIALASGRDTEIEEKEAAARAEKEAAERASNPTDVPVPEKKGRARS